MNKYSRGTTTRTVKSVDTSTGKVSTYFVESDYSSSGSSINSAFVVKLIFLVLLLVGMFVVLLTGSTNNIPTLRWFLETLSKAPKFDYSWILDLSVPNIPVISQFVGLGQVLLMIGQSCVSLVTFVGYFLLALFGFA